MHGKRHFWQGHAKPYSGMPAIDVLKVTHEGQQAAMRPASHRYCGSLF